VPSIIRRQVIRMHLPPEDTNQEFTLVSVVLWNEHIGLAKSLGFGQLVYMTGCVSQARRRGT
jgi:hypothetical protein